MEKFHFEKNKYERDLQLRERELTIRENELKTNRSKVTPTHVAIYVALVGVIGTCVVALLQGYTNIKLERQKFESEIILKVATSDSIERNKKNLEFMLKAGFITDEQGKINKLVKDANFDLKIQTEKRIDVHNELPPKSLSEVYVCHSATSLAYHNSMCRGLKRCADRIDVMTIEEAKKTGHRKPCSFCYK